MVEALLDHLRQHGAWRLSFTPTEIYLAGELVVGRGGKLEKKDDAFSASEERLPLMFYRDGIRSIQILPNLSREEAEALFDALALGCAEKPTDEDLVTLLWQASLAGVSVESVPFEQAFYVSGHSVTPHGSGIGSTPMPPGAEAGAEAPAIPGPATGAQGDHLETFDDWPMMGPPVEVAQAFHRLQADVEASRRRVSTSWAEESGGDWDHPVPEFFRRILALDPTEETRSALAHATATWLTGTLATHQVGRAAKALEFLNELDPDHARCRDVLARGLEQIDAAEFAEYLDEADTAEAGTFAGIMSRLDDLAASFTFDVMGNATRSRTREAAATALCYQCSDHPERLKPFLDDPRADVVLNLVFVLGQIGGPGVADMLRAAAQHPDSRVRRQAVLSVGGVPEAEQIAVLLDELARLDPHILTVTLNLLARQHQEKASKFVLRLMEDREFQTRGEDVQRALFNALAEVAEDSALPELERLLSHGHGRTSRRSFTQFAAAVTLRRLGTPAAKAILEAGLKSRDASVRNACEDAMNSRAA